MDYNSDNVYNVLGSHGLGEEDRQNKHRIFSVQYSTDMAREIAWFLFRRKDKLPDTCRLREAAFVHG
jgi:hypothetical protein